jgi:hypothetical protein
MTRDTYVVSKLDDIWVGHLPVKRLSGFFSMRNVATLASHGALAKY